MKKVAIFGNAGGGKSTLAYLLAGKTQLPLLILDKIQYRAGGEAIPEAEFLAQHANLLAEPEWIIDGFGNLQTVFERIEQADTLIYVDLPLITHYWWVTKRCFTGLFVNPQGWPDNSPILKSTFNSYKVLWLCHTKLTPVYRRKVAAAQQTKRVYHIRSRRDINRLLAQIQTC